MVARYIRHRGRFAVAALEAFALRSRVADRIDRRQRGVVFHPDEPPSVARAQARLAFGRAVDKESGIDRAPGKLRFGNGARIGAVLAEIFGERRRVGPRAVADEQLTTREQVGQVKSYRPRRAASSQNDDTKRAEILDEGLTVAGLRLQDAVDKAGPIGVVADQSALGRAGDRVDCLDSRGCRIDVIEESHDVRFVRYGYIEPQQPFRVSQGGYQVC